jgi:hypothetical protein
LKFQVNVLFENLVNKEIEQGKKEFYYPSLVHFFKRKQKIENSEIFKLLKKFPKVKNFTFEFCRDLFYILIIWQCMILKN